MTKHAIVIVLSLAMQAMTHRWKPTCFATTAANLEQPPSFVSRYFAVISLCSTKESLGDATDFLSQVDEVSRLIDGLKSGTVSPDYIDKKFEKSKEQEQKRVVEDKKKKEEEEKVRRGRGRPSTQVRAGLGLGQLARGSYSATASLPAATRGRQDQSERDTSQYRAQEQGPGEVRTVGGVPASIISRTQSHH